MFFPSLVVALIISVFLPNATNAEKVELVNEKDALKVPKEYSQRIGIWGRCPICDRFTAFLVI